MFEFSDKTKAQAGSKYARLNYLTFLKIAEAMKASVGSFQGKDANEVADALSEKLGFTVTCTNARNVAKQIGFPLKTRKPNRTAAASSGIDQRFKELEDQIKALKDQFRALEDRHEFLAAKLSKHEELIAKHFTPNRRW